MSKMKFLLMTKDGAQEKEINYDQVFAIGYAGRNMEKTMEHIRELEEQLGVCLLYTSQDLCLWGLRI